jgi:hypothetical protein
MGGVTPTRNGTCIASKPISLITRLRCVSFVQLICFLTFILSFSGLFALYFSDDSTGAELSIDCEHYSLL